MLKQIELNQILSGLKINKVNQLNPEESKSNIDIDKNEKEELEFCIQNISSFDGYIQSAIFKSIDIKKDPFLQQIVFAKELGNLMLMKHKNRIILPQSASLIGVIDPFNILQENEIFVCIHKFGHS